jgi:hypothetical protein
MDFNKFIWSWAREADKSAVPAIIPSFPVPRTGCPERVRGLQSCPNGP